MSSDTARNERKDLDRREFLRRAALTGVAAAWAAPLVQTIAATPGFAQAAGSPAPCFHSVGGPDGGGCMSACTTAATAAGVSQPGDVCDGVDPDPNNPLYSGQGPCQFFCPSGQGGNNPCCNPGLCVQANFAFVNAGVAATEYAVYTGSLVGCPS